MRGVTIRQLQIFAAAAGHLSFARTSEQLHLTQAAVSLQIKQLEEQVGLPLFEHVGRRVQLTAAGHEVARYSRAIMQLLREADESLNALKGTGGGELHIAVVSTAKYFAPKLLAEFRRLNPQVKVRLSVSNREAVVHDLAENQIDLALMGQPPRGIDTIAVAYARHPLAIIAAPDHPLARKRRVELKQLAGDTFIIRERGSGTRTSTERVFAERGFHPAETMEMSSNETIKQAVMAGMGVSFLSLHTIGLERRAGLLAVPDIEGLPVLKRWYVVNNLSKTLSPAAEAFRYFILEEGERFLAKEYGTPEAASEAREPG
jgi:DNA-binding transcriptional LysR family regulator